jgi:hypothetical protein
LAPNALVKPLGQTVLDEFFAQEAQVSLTKNHEVLETLLLDCLHEPLGVWIALQLLVDRARDHRDEELERRRQHSSHCARSNI